jgi:hypothetical protein
VSEVDISVIVVYGHSDLTGLCLNVAIGTTTLHTKHI